MASAANTVGPIVPPSIGNAHAAAGSNLLAEVEALGERVAAVRAQIGRAIYGQQEVVDQTLITLLSGGHVLLVGVPGLGKSRLVETLGTVLGVASKRVQFGKTLKEHPLIQEMLANMFTHIQAARALCCREACLRQSANPQMILEGAAAKYFASRVAVQAASDAVQIHGANGFSRDYPVQRYYRDAKVLEVIEGSSQILQMMIARNAG